MATDNLWIEGIPFYTINIRDLGSLRDGFVVRDEDVIILSYPKSGTNWMKEIINLVHTRGDPSWEQSVVSWERSPWIETLAGLELIKKQKDPRFYTSHLPVQLFPKSLFTSQAKFFYYADASVTLTPSTPDVGTMLSCYGGKGLSKENELVIYIMRNPRDVIISGYHFHKTLKITRKPNSLEEYFEWFLRGNVPFGSWFDHVGGWLQMRGKENFFLISYEELHQDIRVSVEKVSQFLGTKLSPEELDSVLKNVTFQAMKDNKMSNFSLFPDILMDHSKGCFMRKGIVGDWKNQLTVAQSEAFDKVYQEKMAGLPPGLFPWE